MKTALIILGALVATALAGPQMPKMPNLNMLNNLKDQMPQIPPGMKLDDLKDAFHNMPSSMKDRLSDMAKSFGMELDDVEDALNNPPQQLKDYFEKGSEDKNSKNDGTFKVPNMDDATVEDETEGPRMPNLGGLDLGDMLKNVDIDSIMQNMDLGAVGDMMKGMDIGAMMKNVDMGAIGNMMKNMDIGSMMQNMDMGAMGDIMKNMDMGAIGNIMKNMDMGAMGDMMKNMDMGAMGDIMKNMGGPMGAMLKNVDIGSISKMMGGKLPDIKNVMGMVGIPEDASPADIMNTIKDKVKGIAANPMETLQWAKEKLSHLELPEGMEITDLLNMAHGQLEAMGIPADPEKIKEMLGLEDLNLEDLKDPQAIAEILRKRAFRMMGLDENEDPMTIKKRIEEQLLEEAQKMGAELSPDSTPDQVKAELDRTMTKQLKNMGLEVDSFTPHGLQGAVKAALSGMGFPMHDLGALKGHVMKMVMKKLMSKVTPMIINMFMPHPRPQMPPMMQQRLPMMPRPPMMPLDLNIEVNVEQPKPQVIPVPMPGYLRGAEVALRDDIESFDSDESVFHHIMAVREALRTGEMPDDALEEMIEDLMNARLKARVLGVKNMFLRDRLQDMEQEMEMLERDSRPVRMPARMPVRQEPRRSSIMDSPILKALKGMRVL